MTWAEEDDIEYNTIVAFKTSYSNMPVYYIFRWEGDAYILQEKHTWHAFDPPVIIHEGELVFPAKFITPMSKTSYWYHKPDEAITVMLKFKKVVMP